MKLKSNLNAVSPSAAKLRQERAGGQQRIHAGLRRFTAYQPVNCAMMPSPQVMRMPQRMAPLTLKYQHQADDDHADERERDLRLGDVAQSHLRGGVRRGDAGVLQADEW